MPPLTFIPAPLLSPRQAQLVATIDSLTAARGFAPSVREIAAAMNVSLARAAQLIASTEWKGAVTREPGVARSIRITKPAPSNRRR
jgi:SOS-response transcriptional repressor LexA